MLRVIPRHWSKNQLERLANQNYAYPGNSQLAHDEVSEEEVRRVLDLDLTRASDDDVAALEAELSESDDWEPVHARDEEVGSSLVGGSSSTTTPGESLSTTTMSLLVLVSNLSSLRHR